MLLCRAFIESYWTHHQVMNVIMSNWQLTVIGSLGFSCHEPEVAISITSVLFNLWEMMAHVSVWKDMAPASGGTSLSVSAGPAGTS